MMDSELVIGTLQQDHVIHKNVSLEPSHGQKKANEVLRTVKEVLLDNDIMLLYKL